MIKQMSLIALGAATLFMAPTVVHAKVNDTGSNTVDSEAKVRIDNSTTENLHLVSAPDIDFGSISNNHAEFTSTNDVTDSLTVRNPKGESWSLSVSASVLNPNISTNGDPIENAVLNFGAPGVSKVGENHFDYTAKPVTQTVANAIGHTGATIMKYTGDEAGEYAANYKGEVSLKIPKWARPGDFNSSLTWTLGKVS